MFLSIKFHSFMQGFKQFFRGFLLGFLALHIVEDIEQDDSNDNHGYHGDDHDIENRGDIVELGCTGFELAVLAGRLLQVEIGVAVVVALHLVVECGISQTHLLADGSHKVGRLEDSPVVIERMVQTVERRLVIPCLPIALGKSTMGSCRLINIAIAAEEIERSLGKVAGKQVGWHLLDVEILEGRQVVPDEELPVVFILDMFADCLQGISLPVRIRIRAARQHVASDEHIEFCLQNLVLSTVDNRSTRTVIVKIVQILGCVLLQGVRVYLVQGLHHRLLQLHIIEIGGSHNRKL